MKAKIRTIEDRNATAVEVRYGSYQGTGVAKREPGDVRNSYVGIALASARAFNDLAIQLEADAVAQVVAAERLIKIQQEVRAQAVKPPVEKPLLSIDEIKAKYGKEAARRAYNRRASRKSTKTK